MQSTALPSYTAGLVRVTFHRYNSTLFDFDKFIYATCFKSPKQFTHNSKPANIDCRQIATHHGPTNYITCWRWCTNGSLRKTVSYHVLLRGLPVAQLAEISYRLISSFCETSLACRYFGSSPCHFKNRSNAIGTWPGWPFHSRKPRPFSILEKPC